MDIGSYVKDLTIPSRYPFYIAIIVLIILSLWLVHIGFRTEWYEKQRAAGSLTGIVATLAWSLCFFLSLLGFMIVPREILPGVPYLLSIFIIGLLIGLVWDVTFLLARNLQGGLLVQLTLVIYYLWFVHEISRYNVVTAIFQLPLVIWSVYVLFALGLFT